MGKMWEKAPKSAERVLSETASNSVARHQNVTNRILPSTEVLPKPVATRV
jgi:hypothetical protein